jgi:hypothetical protein
MYYKNQLRGLEDVPPYFKVVKGRVSEINHMRNSQMGETEGCVSMYAVEDEQANLTNFIIGPNTYFVDRYKVQVGSEISAFYNGNAPAILIYPPQLPAVVVAENVPERQVVVDRFDNDLVNFDGTLKLNITQETVIELENGQDFEGNLAGRSLVVVYSITTRSIPAQTVPEKIIVLCR